MANFKLRERIYDLIALGAGCLLPLAFAPFKFYPLAIVCPILLLLLWYKCSARQALWRGFLFGLGYFGIGVSWVFISIHEFGNAGVLLAGLFTALMVTTLALFPALQGYFLNLCLPRNNATKLCLAFPSSWVLMEWLRSWIFTGFPWLFLGASQIESPLRGLAPLIGELGLSFVVTLSAGLLLIIAKPPIRYQRYISLLVLFIIWLGAAALIPIQWTQKQNKPITVALIQGDIPQQVKWTPEYLDTSLQRYQQLTQQHWNKQLIVWPETAIPLLQNEAKPFLDLLTKEANQHQAAIITGIPVQEGFKYYNAMIVLGNGQGSYHKYHLVPFGEYTPLVDWLGKLLSVLQIPMSDFSNGPEHQNNLQALGLTIAPFICYEIAYEQSALQAAYNAQLLITISNDAWFGHSFASAQHLQIGQLRALETGHYHLFVTNSGITAIINPQGQIVATAPSFEPTVVTGEIYSTTKVTPIARMGITPIIGFMTALLLLAGWRARYQ